MYSFFLHKIILPLGSVFFSGNYSKYLREWRRYDKMTGEDLEKIQQENLSKIIRYAQKNVPYYQNLGLSEDSKIEDFPILSKSILRDHAEDLISSKHKKGNLEKNYSSGSSGVQSFTYMTYDHKFYLRALQTHWWTWGGYKPGMPLLQAGMSPNRTLPKKLKDFFFGVEYFEAFNLHKEKIQEVLKKMDSKKEKHIAGYPSALNEIALIAIGENKVYNFGSIISYGDKLFEKHRKNFNHAFKHPNIVNTYGCAEGLLIACTADFQYYYIMSPHVL